MKKVPIFNFIKKKQCMEFITLVHNVLKVDFELFKLV